MKRVRLSHGTVAAVLGLVLAPTAAGACGDDRARLVVPETRFEPDASLPDAPDCRLQCSLDGRSVVEACSGSIVETCPPDLACGGAACVPPCAAAGLDRSSNGCEFYFQAPRIKKT